MNIQIYLDTTELTKRISEYIWSFIKCPNEYPNIFEQKKSNTDDYKYYMLAFFVPKYVLPYSKRSKWTKIVTNSQNCSREYMLMARNWPNKFPKKCLGSRMYRTNIRIYSEAQEMTEQISEYMQVVEKPRKLKQIIFVGHVIPIFRYLNICAHHWLSQSYY